MIAITQALITIILIKEDVSMPLCQSPRIEICIVAKQTFVVYCYLKVRSRLSPMPFSDSHIVNH